MVALSPVSHRTSALAAGRVPARSGAESGFAQALAALGNDDDDDTPPAPSQRQDAAGDGKGLPDAVADPAGPATLDTRLLWLPAGLLTSATVAINVAVARPAPVPVAVAVVPEAASAAVAAGAASNDVAGAGKPGKIMDDAGSQTSLADLLQAAGRDGTPHVAATGRPTPVPLPVPVEPQPAQSATPAITTELAALGLDPTARDDRRKAAADPRVQPATLTTEAALQNAVQPIGDAARVPLDPRGDSGLRKMIDHIEVLRDGADASDTRIRLVPDALGTVDVAIQRSGDAIHVHFTAENPATRTLLSETQPRLVELAEQRGVRIAGTSVDAGAGGDGGGQPPHPQRPTAPIPNVSVPTTIDATGDDARLA